MKRVSIGVLVAIVLAIAFGLAWFTSAPKRSEQDHPPDPQPFEHTPSRAVAVGDEQARAIPLLQLETPEAAVDSAVRALASGDGDAFRSTLLPSIRLNATDDVIARCRLWISSKPVRPDWEMAETVREHGHDVRRVSMFGKSTTGFHEVDGRWLADRIWCLPIGVP